MSSSNPPWVSAWKKHLDGKEKDPKYNVYALSTLSTEGLPKVRHVIHRALTPSNIFVITTDMRMQKSFHLAHNPTMEIAWWLDPAGVQFRISGKAFPFPNQSTPEGSTRVEDALRQLRTQGEDSEPGWWEKERMRVWKEGMSGHLRASFARPPPGKPLDEVSEPDTWPTRLDAESDDPEEKKQIESALKNFALVAIQVDAFEYLELAETPNRRTQWIRQDDGSWEERKVAP
ncbi:hypothetical protein JCM24511_05560 [Saitozyma sp. JCM 24511]|nr:hypothetical protein JCM24511_05560 [Saitozyma sp. JCM 24511]